MKAFRNVVIVFAFLVAFSLSTMAQGGYSQFVPEKRNTISASVGGGLIFSDIYTPYKSYSSKGGLDWRVDYSHIFKIGIGFGLQYSGFHTNFDEGFDVNLTYIAPQFVYRFKLNSFVFSAGTGVGYSHYKEKGDGSTILIPGATGYYEYSYKGTNSKSGIGFNFNAGAEYMLAKNIGVGVTVGLQTNFFDSDYHHHSFWDDDDLDGIVRMNILGGLHFYF